MNNKLHKKAAQYFIEKGFVMLTTYKFSNFNIPGPNPKIIWAIRFFTNTEGGYLEIKYSQNNWEYKWCYTQHMFRIKNI